MKNLWGIFIFFFLILSSCGGTSNDLGGTEAGNPSIGETRTVTGDTTDTSSTADLVSYLVKNDFESNLKVNDNIEFESLEITPDGCWADHVEAVSSRDRTEVVDVDSDCTFSLSLRVNRGYRFRFFIQGHFVTELGFEDPQRDEFADSFLIPSGDGEIQLGRISFGSERARPARDPLSQIDRDHDGILDFEDDDDDNDGILDADEDDCDGDGFLDDFDEDDACDPDEDDAYINDLDSEEIKDFDGDGT